MLTLAHSDNANKLMLIRYAKVYTVFIILMLHLLINSNAIIVKMRKAFITQ